MLLARWPGEGVGAQLHWYVKQPAIYCCLAQGPAGPAGEEPPENASMEDVAREEEALKEEEAPMEGVQAAQDGEDDE